MKQYDDVFNDLKNDIEDKLQKHSIVVKTGYVRGEFAYIKLLKDHWTTSAHTELYNDGVFFSIWVEPKDLKKGWAKYNIHALKLTKFPGYNIKAVEFAKEFRKKVRGDIKGLPNIEIDIGPQNLFKGYIDSDIKTLKKACMPLIENFVKISPVIDDMFAQKKSA